MSEFAPRRQAVLDFLLARRSHPCVTMCEPGPGDADLKDMLTAAARVPDHGKLAPWRFIIYRGDARQVIGQKLLEIAEAKGTAGSEAQREVELSRFTRAPVVVGVVSKAALHPKIPVWEQELSVGASCMNLVSAAAACGFASQWLSEWVCFDDDAAAYLGAQEGERFAGFVYIGTPTQAPFERPRPNLDDIVSEWKEG
ncbi:nitroreductase [Roseibium sp.]|uniref:nitroreductase family protein n=1 Tax=Roseibium sp. TaxID=1936156 RepID=UPI003A96C3F8